MFPAPSLSSLGCNEQNVRTACRLEGRCSHLASILDSESIKKVWETDMWLKVCCAGFYCRPHRVHSLLVTSLLNAPQILGPGLRHQWLSSVDHNCGLYYRGQKWHWSPSFLWPGCIWMAPIISCSINLFIPQYCPWYTLCHLLIAKSL